MSVLPSFTYLPKSSRQTIMTRRYLLQGTVAVTVSALLPASGFSSSSTSVTSSPMSSLNPQPVPASLTPASVTVSATSAGTVGPGFAGFSCEKYQIWYPAFKKSNKNKVALFKRLGPSVLRIGGNSGDQAVWTPKGKGQTKHQIAPSDVDALAAFLKTTGWQCIYGINLAGSAPGAPYPTTPALAAAEVAYVVGALGSSLLGIEIGNEPDTYGHKGNYYPGNWSLGQFETLWEQYRSAILAATPGAPLTGPATADPNNIIRWTIPFGQYATKSKISLLTQHYYINDATTSVAYMLAPDAPLATDLRLLRSASQDLGIPFRISECNNYSGHVGGVLGISNTYASSLWAIDFLFNCAAGGAAGVNFQGGGNAIASYAAITDANGTVDGVRPEYYGILFFVLAGQGTLYQTTVSAGSLNVTAYAVRTPSGGLNLIISNKGSSNLRLNVHLPQNFHNGSLLEMTQLTSGATTPNLAATSGVTIQGSTVATDGTFSPAPPYYVGISGSQLTCYVPALSAVLLQLS